MIRPSSLIHVTFSVSSSGLNYAQHDTACTTPVNTMSKINSSVMPSRTVQQHRPRISGKPEPQGPGERGGSNRVDPLVGLPFDGTTTQRVVPFPQAPVADFDEEDWVCCRSED